MMNATYITKKDKNGKDRYYKVVDGKMKNVSKAEYEDYLASLNADNQNEETAGVSTENDAAEDTVDVQAEQENETVPEQAVEYPSGNVEDIFYAAVKGYVEATGSEHASKVCIKKYKKCATINYRNCMLCSLVYDKMGQVSSIKFMGTSQENRKDSHSYDTDGRSPEEYKAKILEQMDFIDVWYLEYSLKAKAKEAVDSFFRNGLPIGTPEVV